MRKFSILVVAAVLGVPALASATDYGKTGAMELGGEVSLQSTSQTVTPKGGSDIKGSTTAIKLAPEVGYFMMDQLELIGRLAITSSAVEFNKDKSGSSSGFGLGVGAAYMLPMSGIHVGPRATIGYATTTTGDKDTTTASGPEIKIGGVAKVPFGGGGLLGAGLDITYDSQSYSGAGANKGFKGSGTSTGFGLGTSFSVYW